VIQDERMECQKAVEQKCFIAQETTFKSYKVNPWKNPLWLMHIELSVKSRMYNVISVDSQFPLCK